MWVCKTVCSWNKKFVWNWFVTAEKISVSKNVFTEGNLHRQTTSFLQITHFFKKYKTLFYNVVVMTCLGDSVSGLMLFSHACQSSALCCPLNNTTAWNKLVLWSHTKSHHLLFRWSITVFLLLTTIATRGKKKNSFLIIYVPHLFLICTWMTSKQKKMNLNYPEYVKPQRI